MIKGNVIPAYPFLKRSLNYRAVSISTKFISSPAFFCNDRLFSSTHTHKGRQNHPVGQLVGDNSACDSSVRGRHVPRHSPDHSFRHIHRELADRRNRIQQDSVLNTNRQPAYTLSVFTVICVRARARVLVL